MLDVLIIGGGISGTHSAYELSKLGLNFQLVEARDRLGGRIHSTSLQSNQQNISSAFDLGPSWFWPGQMLMQNLINELELSAYVYWQYAQGEGLYENDVGGIFRGYNAVSMAGSYRLKGGMISLVNELAKGFDQSHIHLNTCVVSIANKAQELIHTTVMHEGEINVITSRWVILALPPRLIAQNIELVDVISLDNQHHLQQTPTWMANQAKVVVCYEEAFWREIGFSGDAFSAMGPLREIHDASTDHQAALFGFVNWSINKRNDADELKIAVIKQLARLFGDKAQYPIDILIKDWAQDPYTASNKDLESHQPQHANHSQDLSLMLSGENIIFSGAEMASIAGRNNGYLEGALESSFKSIEAIKKCLR